jgi:hypothetical protein
MAMAIVVGAPIPPIQCLPVDRIGPSQALLPR